MATHISHSALPYPIKNARFTLLVPFLDSTGTPTDPTTPDTEVSQDGGAFADAAEEVTTISGSNGCGYVTITGAEMNNSAVALAFKVASGPKATLATLYPRNLPILASGTASAGAAGTITLASSITYDITGCFVRTTGGTGGGGTGGANNQARRITGYVTSTQVATVTPNWETTPDATTTYDVLCPEGVTIGMLKALNPTIAGNTFDVSSGGEGGVDWANVGGKTTVNALTNTTVAVTQKVDVDTIKTNAVVNGGTVTFPTNATLASTTNITAGVITTVTTVTNQLTAAQIATGVWQDSTAGDFTASSSIGKGLYTSGVAPGAAGGLFIAGTNAATTVTTAFTTTFTGNLTGNVGGNVTGSVGSVAAGGITATSIADGAIDRATFAADTGLQPLRSNTAVGGANGSITLDASASAVDDLYKNALVVITGGTGVGQSRTISGYTGTSKVATVTPNWGTNPDNTSTFAILPAGAVAGASAPTVGEVADAVWDEARSGHVSAGTFGEYVLADVQTIKTQAITCSAGVTILASVGTSSSLVHTAGKLWALDGSGNAIAPASDTTSILARIGAFTGSGINTILGFFKALFRSDASAPSDLGGTFDPATDSTQAIRDRGDLAWTTATGFSTHTAGDVWGVATRVLTAGTNIVLAKGTGVTGFNDPTAAAISTQVASDLATAHGAGAWVTATGFAVAGDAMALTSGERTSTADAILGRSVATCEGTAAEYSLCTVILAMLESNVTATTWTIKRTNGVTTHLTKTLTTDPDAEPITSVS